MSKVTVIAISIHPENENQIFGEGVINMRIEDEAGGGFFVISQNGATKIRLNPDELYLLAKEGKKLIDAYEKVAV